MYIDYDLETMRDKTLRWLEDLDQHTRGAMRACVRRGQITQQDYWDFEEGFDATMEEYDARAREATEEEDLLLLMAELRTEVVAAGQ